MAQPLAEGKYLQALALARPVEQGVALCAPGLADRGGDGREFLRELEERVPQAEAETCPRTQRPQTLRGAVQAIEEYPFVWFDLNHGLAAASVPKPTVRTVRSDEGNFPKKDPLRESYGEVSRSFKLLCVIMLHLETLFSGK